MRMKIPIWSNYVSTIPMNKDLQKPECKKHYHQEVHWYCKGDCDEAKEPCTCKAEKSKECDCPKSLTEKGFHNTYCWNVELKPQEPIAGWEDEFDQNFLTVGESYLLNSNLKAIGQQQAIKLKAFILNLLKQEREKAIEECIKLIEFTNKDQNTIGSGDATTIARWSQVPLLKKLKDS